MAYGGQPGKIQLPQKRLEARFLITQAHRALEPIISMTAFTSSENRSPLRVTSRSGYSAFYSHHTPRLFGGRPFSGLRAFWPISLSSDREVIDWPTDTHAQVT
jgi:hypothetical protein